MKPAVLMTDPRFYAIRGGANPHTRNADDTLKEVDLRAAMPQWHAYVDALLEGGVDVYVVEPREGLTGMVFAANAGFLEGRLEGRRSVEKTFYPSHFRVEHRVGEAAIFEEFMRRFGFQIGDYDEALCFEGEADAFPVGRGEALEWIFTSDFRSDAEVADWLEGGIIEGSALRLKLCDPHYYHGDTVICDLGGPLLAYRGGLDARSWARLKEKFGGRVIELSDRDAEDFVANSFYVETKQRRRLYSPAEISEATRARVEGAGVEVVPVDISEFFRKGGGGPKCMVFNLGEVGVEEEGLSEEQREFRRERHVEKLRERGYFK